MEAEAGHLSDLLTGGVIMLGASLLFVLIFRRFGIGAVLGYIVAGICIGPQGFGLIHEPEAILEFSEIGIILLLFLVGLELAPSRLMRLKADIFGLGLVQVVACGIILFLLVMVARAISPGAALALGLPLALSSTAQVLPMLQSSGRLNTPSGEKAFSILLFQDLSIIPLLTIIAALSRAPLEGGETGPTWLVAIYAAVAIVGLVLAGRYLLQPLMRLVGTISERELFIVTGLVAILGSAALMDSLGLSPALGAFIAGVMLADSPYRHELEADIDPFRSLLLGFFFLAVGMMLDLAVVRDNPGFVLLGAVVLVAVKAAIITGLARLFGLPWAPALGTGLLLSQGGEFGFVLFAEAEKALLILPEASSLFGAIITVSMVSTPFLMLAAKHFTVRWGNDDSEADLVDPERAEQAKVIVVGHGRFGQTAAQMLRAAKLSVTLIDIKPDQIDQSQRFGRKVFYGDGTRVDLLRRAGAEEAGAILFCLDDRKLTAEQLEKVHETFPNTRLFIRAFDRRHLMELKAAHFDGAVREVHESAVLLARQAMQAMDLDQSLIDDIERQYRHSDKQRLQMQYEEGSMLAGRHLAFGLDEEER